MELPAYTIADVIDVQNRARIFDHTPISCLLTDSRDLTYPNKTAFFALRTEVNNGHNFIPELYNRGVRYFVVDEDIKEAETMP